MGKTKVPYTTKSVEAQTEDAFLIVNEAILFGNPLCPVKQDSSDLSKQVRLRLNESFSQFFGSF